MHGGKVRPGDTEILKHHRRLLAAASALLDHKVTEEYVLIPTLVFATLSDRTWCTHESESGWRRYANTTRMEATV
jgi:hypothetical protein